MAVATASSKDPETLLFAPHLRGAVSLIQRQISAKHRLVYEFHRSPASCLIKYTGICVGVYISRYLNKSIHMSMDIYINVQVCAYISIYVCK